MFGLRASAEAHKKAFDKMLAEIGEEVVVRQPAPKTTTPTTDASKIQGARPTTVSAKVGEERTMVAMVSGPTSGALSPDGTPEQATALGRVAACDLVLRFALSDTLLDETKKHGRTLLDTALDVVVQGTPFKVEAMARGGLPPLGPYILWVGLTAQAVGR